MGVLTVEQSKRVALASRKGSEHPAPRDPFVFELLIVCDACGSLMKGSYVKRDEDDQQVAIAVDKCRCDSPLVAAPVAPFSGEQHHELCLGVLARCYPLVDDALKRAIREAVESAALLGFPVGTKNLERGGPLFTGGTV